MNLTFLWRWLNRLPPLRPDLSVLMYTRPGCCLCDQAWELLVRYQGSYGFTLERMNIEESAELVEKFGSCVPVVTINGRVRFRGGVNEVLLRRMLAP